MRDLFRLANDIQSFCRERGWKFCFIGGLALQRWGEPRLTGDVDLTILTGFGDETAYIEQLCRAFPGRIADAAEFAERTRALQTERIQVTTGSGICSEATVATTNPPNAYLTVAGRVVE